MSGRVSIKQCRKKYDKHCFFCGESKYELLDAHRIFEGVDGGKYNWHNILTVCAGCHRKITVGVIKVIGRHLHTSGKYIIHYIDGGGVERWEFE